MQIPKWYPRRMSGFCLGFDNENDSFFGYPYVKNLLDFKKIVLYHLECRSCHPPVKHLLWHISHLQVLGITSTIYCFTLKAVELMQPSSDSILYCWKKSPHSAAERKVNHPQHLSGHDLQAKEVIV